MVNISMCLFDIIIIATECTISGLDLYIKCLKNDIWFEKLIVTNDVQNRFTLKEQKVSGKTEKFTINSNKLFDYMPQKICLINQAINMIFIWNKN